MELLKQRILCDGHIKQGNILKVDTFLNHQMDTQLLNEIGKEFKHLFADQPITKILTIEASGIAIAFATAQQFGNIPMVFAKKTKSKNLDGELYTSVVESFTRGTSFEIQVSTKVLSKDDVVLIVDDFLARGQALAGLLDIVKQAGATVAGCGIVIEKGFQDGGELIRSKGIRLESLAIIDSIENDTITFRDR
ncbi:MAG: xanthine phosphoribosyltransferase [Oscillospiraceae bacterium]